MRCLNDPSACFEIWVFLLLLNLLPAPLYVRDVITLSNNFLGWLASIALISAKMLLNVIRTIDHDLIQYRLELGHIMSVRPGYDDR